MDIATLDLPEKYLEFYLRKGLTTLYPPQAEGIEKGLLQHKNIFFSIPTASGKTLLAELAMLKAISRGKKAMYIVPLVALASEKYASFKDFVPLNINPGISIGEFSPNSTQLQKYDIIVCTAEKADSLIREESNWNWLKNIDCIILDEVHLLADPTRGPVLEMVISKSKEINPNVQFVSLSATVGNAEEVAKWLQSELVTTNWRPADLREGIFHKNKIQFNKYSVDITPLTNDPSINIAVDTITNGGQCLVFESNRKNCPAFSEKLSQHIKARLDHNIIAELEKLAQTLQLRESNHTNSILAACIRHGTAFHHAGLNAAQRDIVETGFKKGFIKVITCTPTLAAGLNLPARRVIIRNYLRFNPGQGMTPIPVLDYKQMAGRAGRPHLDPYGESVLIAESEEDIENLKKMYITAEAELVISNLAERNNFETHMLATISNKFANTLEDIESFLSKTLFGFQNQNKDFKHLINGCLDKLQNRRMIEICDRIEPTPFGKMVSKIYIYPETATIISRKIEQAMVITPFALMNIISSTPNMRTVTVNPDEKANIEKIIKERSYELPWIDTGQFTCLSQEDIAIVKTSLLLMDWIDGVPIAKIMKKHKTGEGDLKTLLSSAKWLIFATKKIMEQENSIWTDVIADIEKMLDKGATNEAMALMATTAIDRTTARQLFDNGITSLDIMRATPQKEIILILGFQKGTEVLDSLAIDYNIFELMEEAKATAKTTKATPEVPHKTILEGNTHENTFRETSIAAQAETIEAPSTIPSIPETRPARKSLGRIVIETLRSLLVKPKKNQKAMAMQK